MKSVRLAALAIAWVAWTSPAAGQTGVLVTVGSKSFTEAVILGDIAAGSIEDAGYRVDHRRELGGTQILFNALVAGEIDVYAEYSGTIVQEIFATANLRSDADVVRLTKNLRPEGFTIPVIEQYIAVVEQTRNTKQ